MAMSLLDNRKRHLPSKLMNTQNIIPDKILRRDYEINIENNLGKKAIGSKKTKQSKI